MKTLKQADIEKLNVVNNDRMLLLGSKLIITIEKALASLSGTLKQIGTAPNPSIEAIGNNQKMLSKLIAGLTSTQVALKDALDIERSKRQSWEFNIQRDKQGFISKVIARPRTK